MLNANAVMPVTVLANGEYGLNDVCLSLPSMVESAGIINIVRLSLYSEELKQLRQSASIIQSVMTQISFQ